MLWLYSITTGLSAWAHRPLWSVWLDAHQRNLYSLSQSGELLQVTRILMTYLCSICMTRMLILLQQLLLHLPSAEQSNSYSVKPGNIQGYDIKRCHWSLFTQLVNMIYCCQKCVSLIGARLFWWNFIQYIVFGCKVAIIGFSQKRHLCWRFLICAFISF